MIIILIFIIFAKWQIRDGSQIVGHSLCSDNIFLLYQLITLSHIYFNPFSNLESQVYKVIQMRNVKNRIEVLQMFFTYNHLFNKNKGRLA